MIAFPRMNVAQRFGLIAVLVLAGLLRVIAAFQTELDAPFRGDQATYLSYAVNQVRHGVYSGDKTWLKRSDAATPVADSSRPPIYPWFLIVAMDGRYDDDARNRIRGTQVILSTLTVLFAYLFASLLVGVRGGLLVGLLLAISPHTALATVFLLTEPLFAFFVTAAFLALAIALVGGRHGMTWAVVAGALLALAALTRPTIEYTVLPIAALIAYSTVQDRIRVAGALVLSFTVFFAPWIIRNSSVSSAAGEGSLMTAAIHQGMYPGLMYNDDPASRARPYDYDPEAASTSVSIAHVIDKLRERAAREPTKYLTWYLVGKPLTFFGWDHQHQAGPMYVYTVIRSPYQTQPVMSLTAMLAKLLHWPTIVLGVLGMMYVWTRHCMRERGPHATAMLRVASLVLALIVAAHVVTLPLPRYHFPFLPLTLTFAVLSALTVFEWARQRVRLPPSAAA